MSGTDGRWTAQRRLATKLTATDYSVSDFRRAPAVLNATAWIRYCSRTSGERQHVYIVAISGSDAAIGFGTDPRTAIERRNSASRYSCRGSRSSLSRVRAFESDLSLEKPFWEQHELDEIELEAAKIEPNTGAREVDPRARNPA